MLTDIILIVHMWTSNNPVSLSTLTTVLLVPRIILLFIIYFKIIKSMFE